MAENPGTSYNPLFLYGGVGLGKTHLIHAIGNAMVAAGTARARAPHADQYVSDVVKAYQRKAFDDFKRYYHSLDLLLIDDIQFFSGKNRTQEEFFYAFEAMVAQRKQIIITSDTYPKELSGIDSRLISRFDSGLTVAIEPPELEMRVAILLRKAESEGVPMPEEVAFFIAKHLRSNVRELEGALRKVLAYARFHGRDVLTVDVCKEALKDLLSVSNGQITVENIQKTVADFYKIKVADMYSKRRPANIALPRQVAMYLAKELTQKSLPEIGDLFGGRDHTTVLHAVRKISDARAKQAELNHTLHVLEQTLKDEHATRTNHTRCIAETAVDCGGHRRKTPYPAHPGEHPDAQGRQQGCLHRHRPGSADHHACRLRRGPGQRVHHGGGAQVAGHPQGPARHGRGQAGAGQQQAFRAVGQEPLRAADAGRQRVPHRGPARAVGRR